MRQIALTSIMTGAFCAVFAGAVDTVTETLSLGQVVTLGAVSGAVGSFVAQMLTRRAS